MAFTGKKSGGNSGRKSTNAKRSAFGKEAGVHDDGNVEGMRNVIRGGQQAKPSVQAKEDSDVQMKASEEPEVQSKEDDVQMMEEDAVQSKEDDVQMKDEDAVQSKEDEVQAKEEDQVSKKDFLGEVQKMGNPEGQKKKPEPVKRAQPTLEELLNSSRGMGQPLDVGTKENMEKRFGVCFDDVVIHNDKKAHELAKGLKAKAFTRGSDIYFAEGQFKPGTPEGDLLLAHELTHVIQQKGPKQKDKGQASRSFRNEGEGID